LDAEGKMLGWCWHHAAARGDGLLRATLPVVMDIDEDGTAHEFSIHWADINVEIRVPAPKQAVKRGQPVQVFTPNQPMLQVGNPPTQRLPPVTVKNQIELGIPVGNLGSAVGVLSVS
jgi:hypothetical protein